MVKVFDGMGRGSILMVRAAVMHGELWVCGGELWINGLTSSLAFCLGYSVSPQSVAFVWLAVCAWASCDFEFAADNRALSAFRWPRFTCERLINSKLACAR
jgi:hypothetical protein